MDGIKDVLEENGKIPKTSFCPIPEMKVFLPVPEDVTLNRRSRVFPYSQRPILDEAIARWLEDDVITLAPAGNRHNSTLTLQQRRMLMEKRHSIVSVLTHVLSMLICRMTIFLCH
jgi:hypothetical protein